MTCFSSKWISLIPLVQIWPSGSTHFELMLPLEMFLYTLKSTRVVRPIEGLPHVAEIGLRGIVVRVLIRYPEPLKKWPGSTVGNELQE